MRAWRSVFEASAPRAAVLIRLAVGVVFASEGIQKLLYARYRIFAHTFAPKAGLWAFLHESRTDLSMLCGSLFLVLVGGDGWSLDARLGREVASEGAPRRGGSAARRWYGGTRGP
jgi:uncharacterized membrane protein YphA (DoxX/SURF4 family)